MPTLQPDDLRAKASRFRDIARALPEPSAQARLNHYADRFCQQAQDLEAAALAAPIADDHGRKLRFRRP